MRLILSLMAAAVVFQFLAGTAVGVAVGREARELLTGVCEAFSEGRPCPAPPTLDPSRALPNLRKLMP